MHYMDASGDAVVVCDRETLDQFYLTQFHLETGEGMNTHFFQTFQIASCVTKLAD